MTVLSCSCVHRGRIDKTRDKLLRGGLPAPTVYAWFVRRGDGRPCDGCGETIELTDVRISVNVAGVFDGHFHEVCYDAWATFRRQ